MGTGSEKPPEGSGPNEQQTVEDTESEATRYIGKSATLELWVRSGGRCARCNKFLLEDKFEGSPLNLAQRSHIAGWQKSEGSPRGGSNLPVPERNKAGNLILLCYDCHKLVDDPSVRDRFSEAFLLQMKQDHEERIHHLTGMAHDRATAVLRVFGAVRGSIPELAREEALQTVIDSASRYAHFPLAIDKHSIEIDLTHLPEPEDDEVCWRLGKREIDKAIERIMEGVQDKHIRHLSVFAVARIPLLMYLGYRLDDKIPTDLYQKHRVPQESWIWAKNEPTVNFKTTLLRQGQKAPGEKSDVAVILSVSGTVSMAELPSETGNVSVLLLQPDGFTPNPNLFSSEATLKAFQKAWQDLLAELEALHKPIRNIHLFPAIPVTAAISCGRAVMRHVHPTIKVYDRVGPENKFHYALDLNGVP